MGDLMQCNINIDPTIEKKQAAQNKRQIKIGNNKFTVVSVFVGQKTSSELVYDAAVKKILYDEE